MFLEEGELLNEAQHGGILLFSFFFSKDDRELKCSGRGVIPSYLAGNFLPEKQGVKGGMRQVCSDPPRGGHCEGDGIFVLPL